LLSPFWTSILLKSILFLLILAGVPVLNLIKLIPNFFKLSDNLFAAATPSGPLSSLNSPINIFPFKYVPVASIRAFTLYIAPTFVSIDFTFPSSTLISTISACFTSKFSCFSNVCFILAWYFFLSACALKEWTAGPFDVFNILICIIVWSIFFPISPPKASISLTKWPLELPPICGLHGIFAIFSKLIENINVFIPILEHASAASQPACPAPTTATS